MRNQKGITLVALVITIIVLLILAGVSISLVVGQNGVLTQASSAVITNEKATIKQDMEMAYSDANMDYVTKQSTGTLTAADTMDALVKAKVPNYSTTGTAAVDTANSTADVIKVTYTAKTGRKYTVSIQIKATTGSDAKSAGDVTVSDPTN